MLCCRARTNYSHTGRCQYSRVKYKLKKSPKNYFVGYQVDLTEDDLGDALRYLEENMELEIVFYEGRAVGIELPTSVDREVVYTEPGLRGDTTGRAMKPARLATGFEVMVPLFINQNEIIKIDTRTHEYVERVSK